MNTQKGIILVIIGLLLAVLSWTYIGKNLLPSGSSTRDRVSGDAIGTPTNSSTMTALFEDTRTIMSSAYMQNLNLDIRYSPRGSGLGERNFIEILVEGSNDGGKNFFPVSISSDASYSTSTIAVSPTTTAGYPVAIRFPAYGITTTGSSTYQGSYPMKIYAEKIRISVREVSTTTLNTGFVYIRATIQE